MLKEVKMKLTIFCLIVLSALLTVGIIVVWNASERKAEYILETQTYIGNEIIQEAMLTKGERALKIMKFYSKILAVHGRANYRGSMSKRTVAEFIRKCYRYEILLDLGEFCLLPFAIIESEFDTSTVGTIGEIGIFQHHKTVVPLIIYYVRLLHSVSPEVAKEVDPQIVRHEDLRNPIKSLQAQAVLSWGLRREFPDPIYWVSASHWGSHRVYPWYEQKKEPKDYFVFYSKKTKDIYKRSPLMYYFFWERIRSNFQRFNVDLGKWRDDYNDYINTASKAEREYIQSRKYLKKILNQMYYLEQKSKEFDDAMKDINKVYRDLEKLQNEIFDTHRKAKTGKINYETLYNTAKKKFKDFLRKKK